MVGPVRRRPRPVDLAGGQSRVLSPPDRRNAAVVPADGVLRAGFHAGPSRLSRCRRGSPSARRGLGRPSRSRLVAALGHAGGAAAGRVRGGLAGTVEVPAVPAEPGAGRRGCRSGNGLHLRLDPSVDRDRTMGRLPFRMLHRVHGHGDRPRVAWKSLDEPGRHPGARLAGPVEAGGCGAHGVVPGRHAAGGLGSAHARGRDAARVLVRPRRVRRGGRARVSQISAGRRTVRRRGRRFGSRCGGTRGSRPRRRDTYTEPLAPSARPRTSRPATAARPGR